MYAWARQDTWTSGFFFSCGLFLSLALSRILALCYFYIMSFRQRLTMNRVTQFIINTANKEKKRKKKREKTTTHRRWKWWQMRLDKSYVKYNKWIGRRLNGSAYTALFRFFRPPPPLSSSLPSYNSSLFFVNVIVACNFFFFILLLSLVAFFAPSQPFYFIKFIYISSLNHWMKAKRQFGPRKWSC